MWTPRFHQVFKVKWHRSPKDGTGVEDLYTILGNTAPDETAKMVNKRDMDPLLKLRSLSGNIVFDTKKPCCVFMPIWLNLIYYINN